MVTQREPARVPQPLFNFLSLDPKIQTTNRLESLGARCLQQLSVLILPPHGSHSHCFWIRNGHSSHISLHSSKIRKPLQPTVLICENPLCQLDTSYNHQGGGFLRVLLRDYLNDIPQCGKSHPPWVAPFPRYRILTCKSGESQPNTGMLALANSLLSAACLLMQCDWLLPVPVAVTSPR